MVFIEFIMDVNQGKSVPMTPRQRMLTAYQGLTVDTVPVAPEFWYYLPARTLGISMITLEREVPHWQALQQTFRHYGCEGWGIVAPGMAEEWAGLSALSDHWVRDGRLEERTQISLDGRRLTSTKLYEPNEPSWMVERFIKDFDQDWPVYLKWALPNADDLDWKPVQKALDSVGEDYLLEVYVGDAFIDFAGGQREGGFEQVIADLSDRPDEMNALQARYIEAMAAKVRAALTQTTARSVFVGSIWSSLSLLSPALWRRWDLPVLRAVVQAAHEAGGLVHHHFHGRCMGVLDDLSGLSLDCVCPFERPPGGDVIDLKKVAARLSDRTVFNGNVHTVATLINGQPGDVRREVLEILEAFEGSSRLIIGTGDQVGVETPDENIYAMIETARQYGRRS